MVQVDTSRRGPTQSENTDMGKSKKGKGGWTWLKPPPPRSRNHALLEEAWYLNWAGRKDEGYQLLYHICCNLERGIGGPDEVLDSEATTGDGDSDDAIETITCTEACDEEQAYADALREYDRWHRRDGSPRL